MTTQIDYRFTVTMFRMQRVIRLREGELTMPFPMED